MDLSVKEAAHILDASERTVRNYISSGRLPAKRKGRQLFVPEEALQVFMQAAARPAQENFANTASMQLSLSTEALEPIIERFSGLEKKLEQLLLENQRLLQESQQKDQALAQKDLEIEKLQRDLVYQKRLFEKELEDQRRFLDEKWTILQKENEERINLERKHFEEKLTLEQHRWSEKLANQKEQHAQMIVEVQNQEGFWSRLIKMMTWS